jgi:hypothetical protein
MSDTVIPQLPLFRDELSGIEVEYLIIGLYLGQVSMIIEVFSMGRYHIK